MTTEEMRAELGRYRDTVRKLNRRCEEAERWRELARRSSGSVVGAGRTPAHSRDDVGAVVSMADSIAIECKLISAQAAQKRELLCNCIEMVPEARHREVLESVFVNGMTISQLAEIVDRSDKTVERWLNAAMRSIARSSSYFRDIKLIT